MPASRALALGLLLMLPLGDLLPSVAFAGNPQFDPICSGYVKEKRFAPADTIYWEAKVIPEFQRVLESPSLDHEARMNSRFKAMLSSYGFREGEINEHNSQRLLTDCGRTPTMEGCYSMQAYCVRDYVKKELPKAVERTIQCLEPHNRPHCGQSFQTASGIEGNLQTLIAIDRKLSKISTGASKKPLANEYLSDVDGTFSMFSARVQEAARKAKVSIEEAKKQELAKAKAEYEQDQKQVKKLGDAVKAFDQCREYLRTEGREDTRHLIDQVCSASANEVAPEELKTFKNMVNKLRENENEFRRKDTHALVSETFLASLKDGGQKYLESYFAIHGKLPEKAQFCAAMGGCSDGLDAKFEEVRARSGSLQKLDRTREATRFNQAVDALNAACRKAMAGRAEKPGSTDGKLVGAVNNAYAGLIYNTSFGTLMGMGNFRDLVGEFSSNDCLESGEGMKHLDAKHPDLERSLEESLKVLSDKQKELQKQKTSIVDSNDPYPGLRYFLEYEPLTLRELIRTKNDPGMATIMCVEVDKIYRKEKNRRIISGALTGLAIAGSVVATLFSGGIASPLLVAALGVGSVAIGVGTGAANLYHAKSQESKYEQAIAGGTFHTELGQSLVDQYHFEGNAEIVGLAAAFAPGAGKALVKAGTRATVRTGLATSVELSAATLSTAVRTSSFAVNAARLTKPAAEVFAKIAKGSKVYLSELQVALASRVGAKTSAASVALFNGITEGMATDVAITFGVHALAHPDPYSEEGLIDLLKAIAIARGISAIGKAGNAFLKSKGVTLGATGSPTLQYKPDGTVEGVNDQNRSQVAQSLLGRELNQAQKAALQRAHEVGRGQSGKTPGTHASQGNYTPAQLREKVKILRESGLSDAETSLLLRKGLAGDERTFGGEYNAASNYEPGRGVAVLRSGGKGYTNARIREVLPDGRYRVEWEEGGQWFNKDVSASQLGDWVAVRSGHIGLNQEVSIPSSRGVVNGKVLAVLPNGTVQVEVLVNGRPTVEWVNTTQVMDPVQIAAPQTNPSQRSWVSQKVSDYQSRGGEVVEVNLQSPALNRTVNEAVALIERVTGIKSGAQNMSDPIKRERIYQAWLQHVVPMFEDPSYRTPGTYGSKRDQLITGSGGRADLGHLLEQKSAVCRELSLAGSVVFSEFGINTVVQTGNVGTRTGNGGGHAWIRDDQGRIIDNNYLRGVVSGFEEYNRQVGGANVIRDTQPVIR